LDIVKGIGRKIGKITYDLAKTLTPNLYDKKSDINLH